MSQRAQVLTAANRRRHTSSVAIRIFTLDQVELSVDCCLESGENHLLIDVVLPDQGMSERHDSLRHMTQL